MNYPNGLKKTHPACITSHKNRGMTLENEINQSKQLLVDESIDVVLGNKKIYTHSIKTEDIQTIVGLEDIEEIPLM